MLGLTLREEFRGKRLKGTAIELSNDSNTGATQIAAKEFLDITYPTHDLLKGIEAVGPDQGRPVVVIGERGLGKSHLMAALFHAVSDPKSTGIWLDSWASILGDPKIAKITLRDGMLVIGESLTASGISFCGTCSSSVIPTAPTSRANGRAWEYRKLTSPLTN